jgi:hypothetical protein
MFCSMRTWHWLGPWLVFSTIAGCGGYSLYQCGYKTAQEERDMQDTCDHKGGRLSWDKKKCVTEVEIPLSTPSSR